MRKPSLEPILQDLMKNDKDRSEPRPNGKERPPGLQWKQWRVVARATIDSEDYVLLRRLVAAGSGLDMLTAREREAIRHANGGITNKEIAHRMGIAPSTVGVLLSRASRKLGAVDRDDLIRKCSAREPDPDRKP